MSGRWSEEVITRLKELCDKRYSYGTIATMLGGYSRNAVIGKAHRLKITNGWHQPARFSGPRSPRDPEMVRKVGDDGRIVIIRRKRAAPRPRVARAPSKMAWKPKERPALVPMPDAPTNAPVAFLDRRPNQCSHIAGEVNGPNSLCCGAPSEGSWCPYHLRLVYQPLQKSRKPLAFRRAA